jgi:hypothetical protein
VVHGFGVEPWLHQWIPEQGFDLGGEEHLPIFEDVIQRFLAQWIARQEQALLPFVPDGEGEHAAQLFDAIAAQLFVQVHDHFGVSLGLKLVTVLEQLFTQLGKIVYLTVKDDPNAAVLV